MQKGRPKGHWVNEIDKVIVAYTIPVYFDTSNRHSKVAAAVVVQKARPQSTLESPGDL